MRIVVALGGNALLRREESADATVELTHIHQAALSLAPLAAQHELVVCHGNGPQIGLLALESENDPVLARPYPLDVLGAATQGLIGYWLSQSLRNAGVAKPIATVISQVLVDRNDRAFAEPTKFVGPEYSPDRAHQLAREFDWTIGVDGTGWRRVVPSPEPRQLLEQDIILRLVTDGSVVICGGGGGAPVTADETGRLSGVEAVVDKDLTASLLGIILHADRLLVLTDVAAVMSDFGTPAAHPLSRLAVDTTTHLRFPAGSMGPKIEACRRFTTTTGHPAAIGALRDAAAIIAGTAGTLITSDAAANVLPDRGDVASRA